MRAPVVWMLLVCCAAAPLKAEGSPLYRYCPTSGDSTTVQGRLYEVREGRLYPVGGDPADARATEAVPVDRACPADPVDVDGRSLASLERKYWNRSFEERRRIPLADCSYAEGYTVGQSTSEMVLVRDLADSEGLRIFDSEAACKGACLVRLRDPSRSACWRRSLLPGRAQWLKGEVFKSVAIVGLSLGLAGGAIHSEAKREDLRRHRDQLLMESYALSFEAPRPFLSDAERLPLGAQLYLSDMNGLRRAYDAHTARLQGYSAGLLLVYLWNLLDARSVPVAVGGRDAVVSPIVVAGGFKNPWGLGIIMHF